MCNFAKKKKKEDSAAVFIRLFRDNQIMALQEAPTSVPIVHIEAFLSFYKPSLRGEEEEEEGALI